jgi:hypothetical protein
MVSQFMQRDPHYLQTDHEQANQRNFRNILHRRSDPGQRTHSAIQAARQMGQIKQWEIAT